MKKLSFAIIGGGPAGFYMSKLISRMGGDHTVHIYEKELCPFGLLRYGVAPDHVSIKRSQITLSQASQYPFFNYFGNIDIDAKGLTKLSTMYSGIIYAYGAQNNHVPEWAKAKLVATNPRVKFARDLVYWYNGHPSKQSEKQNLTNVRNVAIIGNGNVAIDISRILLRNPVDLKQTEISRNALEQLRECNIENIEVIARRGVTHSAFSLKEVRQLHKLGLKLYAIVEDLEESMTASSQIQCTALGDNFSSTVRMNKRKVDFIKQHFHIISEKEVEKEKEKKGKKIFFRYLLNPKKVQDNEITFDKCRLIGEPFKQKSQTTGTQQKLSFDLLVISTGFQVSPLNSDEFDSRNKRVMNSDGCVVSKENRVNIGKYAAGWCKSGPRGVIDETLNNCEQTANNLRIHIKNNLLEPKLEPQIGLKHISFEKYCQVRQIQLSKGNKQKFIKNKMSFKQLKQFYQVEGPALKLD